MASPAARVAARDADAELLRIRRALLLALALLHVAGVLWLDRAMRLRPQVVRVPAVVEDGGVVIRFLPDETIAPEASAISPALPPVVADPTAPSVPDRTATKVRVSPTVASGPTTEPIDAAATASPTTAPPATDAAGPSTAIDTARLFEPDGSPRLSDTVVEAASAKAAPDYIARRDPGLAPIRSPVPYKPTRFDDAWVPDGESLGQELVRKATPEKEFKTPWGTRWRCKWVLVIAVCGDVPPPAAKNAPKAPWETYEPEPEDPEREIDF
jgi:hypothetical protein